MKRFFAVFVESLFLLLWAGLQCFAQTYGESLDMPRNRQAVLEYYRLSRNAADSDDWQAAADYADMGLSYDGRIADFWFIRAQAAEAQGDPISEILQLIVRAVESGIWIDNQRSLAAVMYADLLSDTGNSASALRVLASEIAIPSADSEYVRAKALYRSDPDRSLPAARESVRTALGLFPSDVRFPLLFFKMEIKDLSGTLQDGARPVADLILAGRERYQDDEAFPIYAALISSGAERVRLLENFNARGLTHPLYALAALQEGLLEEEAAVNYFVSFFDRPLPAPLFTGFAAMLSDEDAKAQMRSVIDAFGGELTEDMNGDGIADVFISYSRGRPSYIVCDSNQDSVPELSAECDFGSPSAVHAGDGMTFAYAEYPAIASAEKKSPGGEILARYTLSGGKLKWEPLSLHPSTEIAAAYPGCMFFIPSINTEAAAVPSQHTLLASSLQLETSGFEMTKNNRIVLSLADGKYRLAEYYFGSVLYARASFPGNGTAVRTADMDFDGFFERTELYESNMSVSEMIGQDAELSRALFGSFPVPGGLYLRQVQIDFDGDSLSDFTELNDGHGGRVVSWDTDKDKQWNVRYVQYADSAIEDTYYYRVAAKEPVCIRSEKGIPIMLIDGTNEKRIVKDKNADFFWIGESASFSDAAAAATMLEQQSTQGVCVLVDTGKIRILAVRIGKFDFGEIIDEAD